MTAPALPMGAAVLTTPAHGDRGWRVLSVGAVVVAVAVTAWIAISAWHPSFPFDEVDQLQMSRLLAGYPVSDVRGAGYYPAWSLLLAPVWWMTSDPFVFFRVAIVIGALVGLLAILPLSRLARRARLTSDQAVVAAAIVVTLPSVSLQADFALSERLLLLMLSLTVLTAWRLWERPGYVAALMFAAAVAATYFTHVRMLVLVYAAVIWLVLFALHHWKSAVVALAVLVGLAVAASSAGQSWNELLLGSFDQGENLSDTLAQMRPGVLARSALGQAWAQVVGSFGLVAIGAVALAVASWRELRRLRAGRATFLLAITLALYLLTTVKWASDYHLFWRPWHRLDVWVYGRYIDPATAIVILIGVAVVIRGLRRAPLWWAAGLSAAVLALGTFWVALDAPTWGYVTPAHIPGVMPWAWSLPDAVFAEGTRIVPTLFNENRFWLLASLSTVVAFAVYVVLRLRRRALACALIVVAAGAALAADPAADAFHGLEGAPPAYIAPVREAMTAVGGVEVSFDTGCSGNGARDSVTMNYLGYWLIPGLVYTYDSRAETPPGHVVVTCSGPGVVSVPSEAALVEGSQWRDHLMYVLPSPLQDELRARGLLAAQG